jgi:hypothetical protein
MVEYVAVNIGPAPAMREGHFSLPVFGEGRGGVLFQAGPRWKQDPTLPSPKTGRESKVRRLASGAALLVYHRQVAKLMPVPVPAGVR